jgi:hypothetical protein
MSNNKTSSGGIGFCGILTIAFIVLKLTHYIDWSWWWVLSPLWAPLALFLIVLGGLYLIAFIKVTFFSTPKQKDQMKRIQEDMSRSAGKSKWQQRMEQMAEAKKKKDDGDAIYELLTYMRNTKEFQEQPDTNGRRFHYLVNGIPVAYISFKHIWGGFKLIPYNQTKGDIVIESVDSLKAAISTL